MRMYMITFDGRGGYIEVTEGIDSGIQDNMHIAFSEHDLSAVAVVSGETGFVWLETIPKMDIRKFNDLIDVPEGKKVLAVEWEWPEQKKH